jgi:LytS/YehU family sensor histidine kinase
MNNDSVISALLILMTATAIWVYIKLREERKKRQELFNENIKLIADNSLLEADQLKYQLQPHTLNNILANLKVFSNKLSKGMDSLSETLDYILYKGNNNLVNIQDELEFINKYLKLNDLFINEIDSVKFDTSKIETTSKFYTQACIPHLITAHFIENAFKHGDLKHPNFLQIRAKLSDSKFQLEVMNKIRPKVKSSNGGIGLKNMEKRLALLDVGEFHITHGGSESDYSSLLIINFPK